MLSCDHCKSHVRAVCFVGPKFNCFFESPRIAVESSLPINMHFYRMMKVRVVVLSILAQVSIVQSEFHIGGYTVGDSCRLLNSPYSQAENLMTAINDVLFTIANEILPDVALGTQSRHGFTAFFKLDAHKEQVAAMFKRIYDGAPVLHRCTVAPSGLTIECVGPPEEDDSTQARICAEWDTPAFFVSDEPSTLFVCPVTANGFKRFPGSTDCPRVRNNVMSPRKPSTLGLSLFGILLHEFMHFYDTSDAFAETPCNEIMVEAPVNVSESSINYDIAPEVYGIQQCATLPADQQLLNAANYGLYASGKSNQGHTLLDHCAD